MLARAAVLSTTAAPRRGGASPKTKALRRPVARSPAVAALSTASTTAPPSSTRKRVTARDFRHPLDQQNTQILQAIPGLSALTKALVTPLAEQMLILEQISTSILVGKGGCVGVGEPFLFISFCE